MTKKEKLLRIALGGAVAAVLALLVLTAVLLPSRTLIGGWAYRRSESTLELADEGLRSIAGLKRLENPRYLDLRGNPLTLKQLCELRERFPDCEIRCEVPIEGQRTDNSVSSLTMTELQEEALSLFPKLETLELREVYAEESERQALSARHPELSILYTRQVVDGIYLPDTAELIDLSGVTGFRLSELRGRLSAFPALERLILTGCSFDNDSLCAFRDSLDGIEVVWDVELYGKRFLSTDTELDISGQWIADLSLLEEALPCFPALQRVILCNCGVSDADMDALDRRYSDIRFLWEVHFGVFHLRTDTTRFLALAWEDGYTWLSDEQLLPLSYCRDMEALDLGHMWFSDTTFLRDMTRLRWLILADNRIKDISALSNLKELTYLELFLCDVEDISPLLECKNLKHLNLAYCPVRNAELLAQLPQLERLWLNGCNVSYNTLRKLQEALPDCRIVTYSESSTGAGWRQHPAYYEMRDAFGAEYME